MSARGASPYVNDIRSSQLRGLPAGTISTLPRIFRHTSFPGYLSFRFIDGGRVPSAQRNHLYPLLCLLGGGSNGRPECHRARYEAKGYVGRGFDNGFLYGRVLHRLEERLRFGPGLDGSAQSLGLLFSCFDGVGRRSSLDDTSRYSIIAALRTSCRYDFDFASYFSTYIFSRISFFFGVSTVVGSFPHNATISTPCFVSSGGVKWPTGVPLRTSRSEWGMSAEVLTTGSFIAAFCIDLKSAFASAQVCTRARRASASFFLVSTASAADPRGTISTIGCILYSKLWVSDFSSPAFSWTSFSPTWRLSLYRPRIRLLQTMSAFRRAFSVSGRMPWVSRDFVSCSPVIRIREL